MSFAGMHCTVYTALRLRPGYCYALGVVCLRTRYFGLVEFCTKGKETSLERRREKLGHFTSSSPQAFIVEWQQGLGRGDRDFFVFRSFVPVVFFAFWFCGDLKEPVVMFLKPQALNTTALCSATNWTPAPISHALSVFQNVRPVVRCVFNILPKSWLLMRLLTMLLYVCIFCSYIFHYSLPLSSLSVRQSACYNLISSKTELTTLAFVKINIEHNIRMPLGNPKAITNPQLNNRPVQLGHSLRLTLKDRLCEQAYNPVRCRSSQHFFTKVRS